MSQSPSVADSPTPGEGVERTDPPPPGLPIRATFLHRPRPPGDAVVRPRLLATLDRGLDLSATLVCAPAGFGKSIIVSQWAEAIDRPVAWLSLHAAIGDPRWFVMHLSEAVRRIAPGALDVVSQMTAAPELPAIHAVITELSNELDELAKPIVVVLDDYHHVTSPEVHEVVSELILHPAESVHFVIISRHEPALPIGAVRLRGQLAELRMADLAFTSDELELFAKQQQRDLVPEQTHNLLVATEGWPAGVRLAIEAQRISGDADFVGVGFLDQAVQDDILAEILDQAPPPVRRHLHVVSHFQSFCAELCDAAIAPVASEPATITGAEFIDWLRRYNLFVVSLDDDGVWYRFHHLFAHLLDNRRAVDSSDPQVQERDVRVRAARVFRAHGMVEDAIEQLHLAGADAELAVVAA
ncbi:MAG: hypothetical protein ACN4IE_21200, partial [Ilumatobacter sp.]